MKKDIERFIKTANAIYDDKRNELQRLAIFGTRYFGMLFRWKERGIIFSCQQCRLLFHARHINIRYCSDMCRKKARVDQRAYQKEIRNRPGFLVTVQMRANPSSRWFPEHSPFTPPSPPDEAPPAEKPGE